MKLEELLKSLNCAEEQISAIMEGMKKNGIYTAGEENLDTRYGKLKTDHESAKSELSKANELIGQLKKGTGDNEALQKKIADYEAENARLKAENEAVKLDAELKVALLAANAKPEDIDYLIFRAKEKGELKLDEKKNLSGKDDIVSALKAQCPGNFTLAKDKRYVEHKLETGESRPALTKDDVLKKPYKERMDIYQNNPEEFNKLMNS